MSNLCTARHPGAELLETSVIPVALSRSGRDFLVSTTVIDQRSFFPRQISGYDNLTCTAVSSHLPIYYLLSQRGHPV